MAGWRMSGEVLIACNCDWGCPCNFNARPSKGFCQGGWIWMVEDGQVGDVGIGGLGLALFAKWPGAIHEGGGRATAYVDARADAAQASALARVLAGEVGGPWGIFSKTYQLARPVSARFDVRLAQHDSRATIGDVVELELTKMRNPVTHAEAHPEFCCRRARGETRRPGGVGGVSGEGRTRARSLGSVRRVRPLPVFLKRPTPAQRYLTDRSRT
jgi:hypothetical protein